MTLSRRVTSSAFLQLGARLFSATVTFVITAVVLARVLSEAEYGFFNFYLTLFLLVMQVVDFGINRAAIRLISGAIEDRATVIRAAISFKAVTGLVAFIAISILVFVAEEGVWTRALLVLAAAHTLSHSLGSAQVAFEVDLDYRLPALSIVLGYGAFLIGGGTLALMGVTEAPPYLVAWGIGIILQNVVLFVATLRRYGVGRHTDFGVLRALAREAVPLGLSAAAVGIYYYSDTVMLRPFRGEVDVAIYSAAYKLMSFGLMVPVLFSQVLFPVLTRCANRSNEVLQAALRGSTFYLALSGAVASAILFGLAPELLELVFGSPYRVAATPLRILAIAMFCVYLVYPHTTALIAAGKARVFTRITIMAALLNVGLNLFLLPRYGPRGAAISTLVTEGFVLVFGLFELWRLVRVTGFSWRLILPILLGAVLVFLLTVTLASQSLPVKLLVAIIVSLAGVIVMKALPFRLGVEEEELE